MEKETFNRLVAINKLSLSQQEEEVLYQEAEAVLEYLAPLPQLDLGDTPIMVWAEGIAPVYREDTPNKTIPRETILAQAPEQADSCFVVPRVAD